jgi:chloride channel protein, CIC family
MPTTITDAALKTRDLSQLSIGGLAVLVGIIAGFGAIVFRGMIGFVHNLLFLGQFSFFYNANIHTPPSPLGWLVIFVPVFGAIIVVFIVKNFAPEAKGHGVPEVMDAIYSKGGKIRPIVVVIKAVASALSIGSGGSVGREGPIVQIGSAFGSILGGITRMSARQRGILVAAGAAGGIAATFNTPLGALAFGIELMLASVSAASLFPVAISTVIATYIGRAFLGTTPSFYVPALSIPTFHLIALKELAIFVPFGVLVGLCSVVFIKGLYFTEDLFNKFSDNYYTRHIIGMFVVGLLMYAFMRFSGHYYIQGVGYATIVDILKGVLNHPEFLLLLVFAKLLSTFLTLGSGASGGIFSPSLFLGAALGDAFGLALQHFFPGLGVEPIVFAMAGMAGMIGGATGAVMTGAIMVIEMTSDTNVVLPIIITVTTAYAIRKVISNESIYTLKLLRRGSVVPEGLQSAIALAQSAGNLMNRDFRVVDIAELEKHLAEYLEEASDIPTLVTREGKVVGLLRRAVEEHKDAPSHIDLYLNKRFLVFPIKTKLPKIMRMMKQFEARYILVTIANTVTNEANKIVGVITEREILNASLEAVSLL